MRFASSRRLDNNVSPVSFRDVNVSCVFIKSNTTQLVAINIQAVLGIHHNRAIHLHVIMCVWEKRAHVAVGRSDGACPLCELCTSL